VYADMNTHLVPPKPGQMRKMLLSVIDDGQRQRLVRGTLIQVRRSVRPGG